MRIEGSRSGWARNFILTPRHPWSKAKPQLVGTLGAGAGAAGAAGKGGQAAAGKAPGQPEASKVVVRNVAFEATRKDILGLFTPFGHVKSCRLPRKFDGTHR